MATWMSHAGRLATFATGTFIAAFSWQPLAGGVMIGAAHARRLYVLTDEQVLREEAEWTVEVSELRAQAGLHVVGAHRGVEGEERDALKTPRLPFRLRRSQRKSVAERLQAVVMWIVSKILRDLFQGLDTGPITGTDG
jgi:hypothetical protein